MHGPHIAQQHAPDARLDLALVVASFVLDHDNATGFASLEVDLHVVVNALARHAFRGGA